MHQKVPISSKTILIRISKMTVGIYFATTTGKTEDIAERIYGLLDGAESPKDMSEVDDLSELANHDGIICGIPTWNTGADSERSGTAWDTLLEEIGELNLSGKKVAIFGLGDSSTYTENFCDAMEELHRYFQKAGATMIGYVSSNEYTFDESKSILGDSFCGLPLDEDSESDMTDARINQWAEQLKNEMPGL